MEYLVTMTTHVPDGISEQAVDDIRTRETAHSRELAAQGHLLRLWRPPLQPGEWRTLGLFAADDGGRIDTLINNAGVFIAKPFTDYTAEDYAFVVGVNLTGFFRLTQRVIAEMVKRGGGHVVNITTTLADYANSSVPSVLTSLTKGGLFQPPSPWPSSTPPAASGSTPSRRASSRRRCIRRKPTTRTAGRRTLRVRRPLRPPHRQLREARPRRGQGTDQQAGGSAIGRRPGGGADGLPRVQHLARDAAAGGRSPRARPPAARRLRTQPGRPARSRRLS